MNQEKRRLRAKRKAKAERLRRWNAVPVYQGAYHKGKRPMFVSQSTNIVKVKSLGKDNP